MRRLVTISFCVMCGERRGWIPGGALWCYGVHNSLLTVGGLLRVIGTWNWKLVVKSCLSCIILDFLSSTRAILVAFLIVFYVLFSIVLV